MNLRTEKDIERDQKIINSKLGKSMNRSECMANVCLDYLLVMLRLKERGDIQSYSELRKQTYKACDCETPGCGGWVITK